MKVLIATDGSDCSREAVAAALRLLPLKQAEAHVIAVATIAPVGLEPIGYGLPAYPPAGTPIIDDAMEAARAGMREACELLAQAGVAAQPIVVAGDPAGEILGAARDLGADVIVVGSHGRNPVERLFLGSVSDAVVHRFEGPVLVVRPARA